MEGRIAGPEAHVGAPESHSSNGPPIRFVSDSIPSDCVRMLADRTQVPWIRPQVALDNDPMPSARHRAQSDRHRNLLGIACIAADRDLMHIDTVLFQCVGGHITHATFQVRRPHS